MFLLLENATSGVVSPSNGLENAFFSAYQPLHVQLAIFHKRSEFGPVCFESFFDGEEGWRGPQLF